MYTIKPTILSNFTRYTIKNTIKKRAAILGGDVLQSIGHYVRWYQICEHKFGWLVVLGLTAL